MLPLAGPLIPDTSEALAEALKGGFAARNLVAREVTALGVWPALEFLRIDLTGAQISRSQLPGPSGEQRGDGFTTSRFELLATPGELESTPVDISLRAEDAGFEFAAGAAGESMLLITRAARGEVAVEVARVEVERLIHSLATDAASQHGVEIKNVKVGFTTRSPRAVSVKADVTAKMFIATATVTLSGDIDLDDQLNARLSNLRFAGDGMVANLAGGFIRPQLATMEGRTFPLMSFALGEITLRDIQIAADETLRLSAQFGS